ncbi:hypothetical protein I3843_07G209000 [Carya illinoinensis]|uniref:Protein KAKU4 n=1 Tax=Carya illinoinensis TaxID=32201 RepID=A0A8T1Q5C0_CARIL|nr:protein KAKU4 [Carya illinoinensis]KAG2699899.1 hypothetical protein I3760_07G209600 [Carya illinoinensis]KAG6649453.1 hypothetical protein CIPAW_07G213400 [Carya illinoinensis]KAG7973013.1 hypothetical protein I3843_07G209000 [Carya illinoinensis]
MATVFRSRRASEPRSGGKVVRGRRFAAPRTPYERPRLTNPGASENPSWLSRLLYSPTRLIASGAGKILSTVFSPEPSSSSASASSSGGDSSFDDDIENDDDDISTRMDNRLIQKDGSSEMIKRHRNEPQTPVGKSETKRLIEQLLMQETFSREECDRLTMIIKSRVGDCLTSTDAEDGRPNIDMPDLCSTAVMEAKKWLEEKKLTDSKDLDHAAGTLNSVSLPPVTEVEGGSPVDMARSYMRGLPPWASPSANHIEFKSLSPVGIRPYKEETPYSFGGNSASSSKLKRESPGTGSWNIQEEIRRVRSKATEEMLRTLPSSKIDWSQFALERKSSLNSLATEKLEDGDGDRRHKSTQPIDTSLNLAIGEASNGFSVSVTQDVLQKEVLSHNPDIIASKKNQDLEATQIFSEKGGSQDGMEGILSDGKRVQSSADMETQTPCDAGPGNVDGPKDDIMTNEQHNSTVGGTAQDSTVPDRKCFASKEMAGTGSGLAANGFPSSGSSLSAGRDAEQNPVPHDRENNHISTSHGKIAASAPMEETCELLSEAFIEVPNVNDNDGIAPCDVPNVNENDSVADDSLDSSSMQNEELSEDLSQPNSKDTVAGKAINIVEKQRGKQTNRYNRKGKGRGRGRSK